MRIFYIRKLLKYLNSNFDHFNNGHQTIWYLKDKAIALWDNGDLEIVWDIFKEGILKP